MRPLIRRRVIQLYEAMSGRRILARLDELNEQQWWSRQELERLQRSKLTALLESAHRAVPYYRRLFTDMALTPAQLASDPAAFRRIPLLTKDAARRLGDELLSTDPQIRRESRMVRTSGSTGEPFEFLQDRAFRDNFTAGMLRHLEWAGARLGELHCYLWSTPPNLTRQQTLRLHLMDLALNRFVGDGLRLSDPSMAAFLAQVQQRRPAVLVGYASSLYRFAHYCREHDAEIRFRGVISSAEVLHPVHRRFIEETWGCPVIDRYGAMDVGGIGCECSHQRGLHVGVEDVLVEVVAPDGSPCAPGERGHVVATNLNNQAMPLIRYRLEDIAAWQPDEPCPCGRAHPMLSRVEGRSLDVFWTRSGTMVTLAGIDEAIFDTPGVKQYQLVQRSFEDVIVRLVRDEPLTPAQEAEIRRGITEAMGESCQVAFEYCEAISPSPSGKHRYWISEIPDQHKPAWDKPA